MQPPFSISISENVERFIFNKNWSYELHYQALFNAQFDLIPRHMPTSGNWAILADWRAWLVQVPEAERLCVRSVGEFVSLGLRHYAAVCEDHPVAKWQAEQVAVANPDVRVGIFTGFEEANEWLREQGYNTEYTDVPFESGWQAPSSKFDALLSKLKVDRKKFSSSQG